MQYDLKEVLKNEGLLKLEWHGEPTMVKLSKEDGTKTEVNTGDVVEVSVEVAGFLLRYSDLWTLEGDKPVEQGWRKARAAAMADDKPVAKSESEDEEGDVLDLSPDAIGKMKKADLESALETLEVEFEAGMKVADMKELLLETVEGATEDAEEVPSEDESRDEDESEDEE